MPAYDYRCQSCSSSFTIERSMSESNAPHCTACQSNDVTRIYSVFMLSGKATKSNSPSSTPKTTGGGCATSCCGGGCH